MTEISATDSFGRRTVFKGKQLVFDTTDTEDKRKPQWLDIDIWRTEGGSYVVQKAVHYRTTHTTPSCARLIGYFTRPSTADDTYPCHACSPDGLPEGDGWAQESRVTVDVHATPEQLIDSFKVDGKYTRLSRTILADLSEQDDRIDRLWNTVMVD